MTPSRSWTQYPATFREGEVRTLAGWIGRGVSAAVVGLAGTGKSNLLGFLCHRPEVVQSYLAPPLASVVLVPVDLNNLPDLSAATFYRVILRAFYEVRENFEPELAEAVADLYQAHRASRDPFLTQSALRELLLHFRAPNSRVALVFDRFDDFCRDAPPPLINSLRGLRDSFKDTLCYLAGMRQEAAYLPDPAALGELYELLDSYVCWVGPMDATDARHMAAQELAGAPAGRPAEEDVEALLALTGRFAALLKAACTWWSLASPRPDRSEWLLALLADTGVQHRLGEMWAGLSQEEQAVLAALHTSRTDAASATYHAVLSRLAAKGVVQPGADGWSFTGEVLAAHAATAAGRGRGRIWLDEATGQAYQGQTPILELAPLERSVLHFLIQQPYLRHTKTDLIVNTWPDELRRQGVSDDSLYQVIAGLRKKIEPVPSQPCYVVNWRGRPEGGYRFFPEGRPNVTT
ncbi:MAG TPA: winged helix-turn-helix domain-containing protein [Anaerolineae bacterium]